MPLLTKDAIESGLRKLPTLDLDVPELGGSVRIRTITGAERDAFELACYENGKANLQNARARFVSLCLVDENGNRLFNDLDAQIIGRGNGAVLDHIYSAAKKHNRIDKTDEADLLKNSGAAQSGGSGSDSPVISE